MNDGTIVSTSLTKVYKYKMGVDKKWKLVFNAKKSKMKNLSRIAVNPAMTKIAIVAESTK